MMKFKVGGESLTLRGDASLSKAMVSLKAMVRTIRHEGQGIYLELSTLSVSHDSVPQLHEQVQLLLQRYSGVLNMPTGLPPHRPSDHQIILREGTTPISVRPYKYPHYQKDEIEKFVKEMLAAVII